ncbi:hypothetical protein [Micromonospora sp. KLBMP9576]|uniref:hypothetical protein n=1 Tax=Micromonospora sp. KLBMP9576 TaxID=3424769 RepID=UPI003D8A6971
MGRLSLRRSRRPTLARPALSDDLIVERHGAVVLVTHPADPPYDYWRTLRTAAGPAGEALVLVSSRAGAHPTAKKVVVRAIREAARATRPHARRVWLGHPALSGTKGADSARLATLCLASGVDIVAADGPFTLLPGGGLYAGPATGAAGWRQFHPDGPGDLLTHRYPATEKESLPDGASAERVPSVLVTGWSRRDARLWWLGDDGAVVAEVVPAGILLRPRDSYASDALAAVDPQASTMTVGTAGLPVPAALVTAVRRLVAGGAAERSGTLRLRIAGDATRAQRDVIAELAEDAGWDFGDPTAAPAARPAGTPARTPMARTPTPQTPVAGTATPQTPSTGTPAPQTPVAGTPAPQTSSTGTATPPAASAGLDAPPSGAASAAGGYRSIVTVSATPVVTVAGPPVDEPMAAPTAPTDTAAPPDTAPPAPAPHATAPSTTAPPDTAPSTTKPPAPAARATAPPPVGPAPASVTQVVSRAEPAPGHPPAEPERPRRAPRAVPYATPRPAAPAAVLMEDRASTAAEQREFVAALGPAYTETLGVVNTALSTWPALRDDSPGARADYAAVCVYLGHTGWGGVRLNAALRAGRTPDLGGYLPCLVSGMRRLPRHRRAVLCQARLTEPVERSYPVGALLTEPAFHSVSARLDVAVPGADVDLLIWSRTACQTSVLAPPERPLEEATFLCGTRFKVLDVRSSKPGRGDGAALPSTAILLREVLPGERPGSAGLDEVDRVALGRLVRALAQRQNQTRHAIEDGDLVARLAGPGLGLAGTAVAYS